MRAELFSTFTFTEGLHKMLHCDAQSTVTLPLPAPPQPLAPSYSKALQEQPPPTASETLYPKHGAVLSLKIPQWHCSLWEVGCSLPCSPKAKDAFPWRGWEFHKIAFGRTHTRWISPPGNPRHQNVRCFAPPPPPLI